MKFISILTLFLVFSNLLQLSAQECFPTVFEGEGTFYDGIAGTSSGNCSLPVAAGDYFHCAMNAFDYDNSNACGACITVTGPKGTITLTVVDSCPECARGDVDMTQEAFSQIADVIDGRVPISWKYTTCENNIDNSIQVVFKEGSSDFYTAIQVRNSIHAISNMEYQLENGSWGQLIRRSYNFFLKEDETGILSPMNLRLTSVLGEQLVLNNINRVANNVEINSNKQFSIPEDCNKETPEVVVIEETIEPDEIPETPEVVVVEEEEPDETPETTEVVVVEETEEPDETPETPEVVVVEETAEPDETPETPEVVVVEGTVEPTDENIVNPIEIINSEEEAIVIEENIEEVLYHNIITPNGEFITQIPKESNISKIKLYNLAGQNIEIETTIINENDINLDTNGLSTGMYIINLEEDSNNIPIVKKIIIK